VTGSVAGQAGRSRRKALGKAGEDLAAAWYEARGYQVLARNWSCRDGELDIVLRHGRLHVFCEVKARSSGAFGLPAEAVGPLKQARVRRLAALWFVDLSRGDGPAARSGGGAPGRSGGGAGARSGGPVRFDVASVLDGEVNVIEDAF
jgi:putative endonuclease